MSKKLLKHNADLLRGNDQVSFLPTGETIFDIASGGGFPKGRISEVFGQEHSGKSAICDLACATTIKNGGTALKFDAEHAWDPSFSERVHGLKEDPKYFQILQPNYLEEILDIVDILIASTTISTDLLIIDSIAAAKPKDIITAAADKEARLGMHAKMLGLLMAKLTVLGQVKGTTTVMVNQLRGAIGTSRFEQNQGTGSGFNPMETFTTPGGYAPRFYASLRMRLEYGGSEKSETTNPLTGEMEEIRVANTIKIINVKNKVATPFLKGKTRFDFPIAGQKGGWNSGLAMVSILEKLGNVSYSGTKMSYTGKNKTWEIAGVKREIARNAFTQSPSLMADATDVLKDLYRNATSYGLKVSEEDTKDIEPALSEDVSADSMAYDETPIVKPMTIHTQPPTPPRPVILKLTPKPENVEDIVSI